VYFHGYQWVLKEPGGARILGKTDHEALGYGIPEGPFRSGTNVWTAARYEGSPTGTPVPITPELTAEVRRQYPDAAGREGFHIAWGMVASSIWLWGVLFVFSAVWWVALRTWTSARVGVRVVVLTLWPWFLGAAAGVSMWKRLGRPDAPATSVLAPELMITGTALLGAVCLVLVVTRWQQADEPPVA
jgi:hypothetical protein